MILEKAIFSLEALGCVWLESGHCCAVSDRPDTVVIDCSNILSQSDSATESSLVILTHSSEQYAYH